MTIVRHKFGLTTSRETALSVSVSIAMKDQDMSGNRSKEGYAKQREWTDRILNASAGSNSITHEDGKGRPVRTVDDVRHGSDMGIDLITNISTKNKQSKARVKNAFEAKLRKLDGN